MKTDKVMSCIAVLMLAVVIMMAIGCSGGGGGSSSGGGNTDTTPPSKPTGLAITPGYNKCSFIWTANTETDLSGYNLYRSTASGGGYAKINSSIITSTSVNDTSVYSNGTAYYYVVTAVDTAGNQSEYSDEASFTSIISSSTQEQTLTFGQLTLTVPQDALSGESVISLVKKETVVPVNTNFNALSNTFSIDIQSTTAAAADKGMRLSSISIKQPISLTFHYGTAETSVYDQETFAFFSKDANGDYNYINSTLDKNNLNLTGFIDNDQLSKWAGDVTAIGMSKSVTDVWRDIFAPYGINMNPLGTDSTLNSWEILVIFIHGIQPYKSVIKDPDGEQFAIGNNGIINYLNNQDTWDKYHFATFSYNSWDSVEKNADKLAEELRNTSINGHFYIVGYSMGGLVARKFNEKIATYNETYGKNFSVDKLIMIATPNSGSPLAVWGELLGKLIKISSTEDVRNSIGLSSPEPVLALDVGFPLHSVGVSDLVQGGSSWLDSRNGYVAYAGTQGLWWSKDLLSGENDGVVQVDSVNLNDICPVANRFSQTHFTITNSDDVKLAVANLLNIGTSVDSTPPSDVSNLLATGANSQVSLTWTDPSDSDLNKVLILRNTTGTFTAPMNGLTYSDGSNTGPGNSWCKNVSKGVGTYTDTGLTNGTTYYYKIFAYDTVMNYSSGKTANATPSTGGGDITPPADVTNLAASAVNSQVSLTWTDPSDSDLNKILLLRNTTGTFTTPVNGTTYSDGTSTGPGGSWCKNASKGTGTYADTGLTNGTTYYYKVFAYDTSINYSSGKTVNARPLVSASVSAIAGGWYHSLASKNDGTVWAWGNNSNGKLGNGSTTESKIPVQVSGLTTATAVAGGETFSFALRNDGTVWAWGYNGNGELGNGSNTSSSIPVQVSGLINIIAIAGGSAHSLALRNDGTVWAWGYNYYGQLGNGSNIKSNVPVQVNGLTGVSAIAGGYQHSIALKSDGTVWAWGYNGYGQLGNGSSSSSNIPVQVNGLTGVSAIAGGYQHSIALKSDGTVWAWGYNGYGQLGNNTTTSSNIPVEVSGLTNVTAIAGGSYHSLASKKDGTVWTWGYNGYGQLGDNTTTSSKTPVQVSGLTGVSAVAGGAYHSLSLKTDGTVWAWGYNYYGQLGDGTTTNRATPVQVSGLN